MSPEPYMISIQYGKGHQYVAGKAYTVEEAQEKARVIYSRIPSRIKKQGAKPTVIVWERLLSIGAKSK